MTSYPGENPPPSDGEHPDQTPEGTSADASPGAEPTQPVGYWERQAAEQARSQEQQGHPGYQDPTTPYPSSGAVFNPTSGQPYGQPSPDPYQPYQQPYQHPGQQPVYPPPGGQSGPPPGSAPGYPPYAFTPPKPDHPQSTLALVLGIVGLAGGFACLIGFLAAPFAWALGRSALKDIERSQGTLGGEGSARAGMVMGIIGTVILVLGVLLLGAIVVVAIASESSSTVTST